ncbi:MAG: potassium channel family protein [Cetobacterium sp.]|nr:potassium channel family protein [Cetobacterium sp.]
MNIAFRFFKILILTIILSLIIPLIPKEISNYPLNVLNIFLSLFPLNFLVIKNFIFKDGIIKATFLIFYYVLLVPFINLSLKIQNDPGLKYFYIFLSLINVFLLISSHGILLKYIFKDIFLRRRRIEIKDVFIVLSTYITIAISFGLISSILDILSPASLLRGITGNPYSFEHYFQHIYFSFITISGIGYGDIVPNSTIIHFLVIIEYLFGFIITNIIVALTLSSGIFNNKEKK